MFPFLFRAFRANSNHREDGSVVYFQDRRRQYPFTGDAGTLSLLRGLLRVNSLLLPLADQRVQACPPPVTTLSITLQTE